MDAVKYHYFKDKEIGLACIVIKPTPELRRLQQELIDAIAPFTVKTGTATAFVTTPEQPDINETTINCVTSFLTIATGDKFNPHVSTGIGTVDYLEKLLAKPFEAFTFSVAGASVYRLGDFGTARKELKSFQFNP